MNGGSGKFYQASPMIHVHDDTVYFDWRLTITSATMWLDLCAGDAADFKNAECVLSIFPRDMAQVEQITGGMYSTIRED